MENKFYPGFKKVGARVAAMLKAGGRPKGKDLLGALMLFGFTAARIVETEGGDFDAQDETLMDAALNQVYNEEFVPIDLPGMDAIWDSLAGMIIPFIVNGVSWAVNKIDLSAVLAEA